MKFYKSCIVMAMSVLMLQCAAVAATFTVPAGGDSVVVSSDASYDSITVAGTLVVSGAKLACTSPLAVTGGTVILEDGATLTAAGVTASSADSKIEFNGGRLVTSGQIKADGVVLSLSGNGGDVLLDFNLPAWAYAFSASSNGKVKTDGNGRLVVSLAKSPQGLGLVGNKSYLQMSQTGRTEIRDGVLSADYDCFPNSGELFVATGAELYIGGMWLTVGSLTGPGRITGREGGQVKISVPEGGTGYCYSSLDSALALIKDGAGVLKVIGRMPSAFTVNGGEIRAVPRSEVGYSQFKFKVDGVGVSSLTGMQLNELAFFAGEEDVTSGYVGKPSFDNSEGIYNGDKIFDRADGKWWYTYSTDPSFEKAWVSVVYPERRVITGYKIKSSDWGGDAPKSWRLYGRDEGGEWELIDQRVDDENVPKPVNNWSGKYVVSCSANPGTLDIQSLTLAKGTKLSAPADTRLTIADLTDNGASYSFAAGSSVDIAAASDYETTGMIGEGDFIKSGAANLVSYGTVAPASLHVKGGVLTFRTPVALKQWKLAIGDVVDASGNELTFGEFAVYDQNGNRLNVTGSATMGSVASSFSSTQAGYLYDGKDNDNQAWVNWGNLQVNAADETTWPWTSFTLADTAPAVYGYNLRTATYPSNGRPKTWKLYARATSSDDWLLIDEQKDVISPVASYAWYDGSYEFPGKPLWRLQTDSDASVAAFSPSVPVTVDPGATLDLTAASGTQLSDIRLNGDAEGFGTIRGGTFAAEGTVRVTFAGEVPRAPYELPLKIVGATGTSELRNWTLIVNGRIIANKHLVVGADGMLTVQPVGFVIGIR